MFTGNYVHDNIFSAGLWTDTNNAGFLFQSNYISSNDGSGIMYESAITPHYRQHLRGQRHQNGANIEASRPAPSMSASRAVTPRCPSNYAGQLNIQGNVFQDNWAGVVVYQNANRHSGDGQDPGTLTPPAGTSVNNWISNATAACPSHLSQTSPINYNSLCQWRSQNVTVQGNAFQFHPSDSVFGGQCTTNSSCGKNGLFSVVSWTSAYPGWSVCNLVSNSQGNHFKNNSYTGPWVFMYFNQGDTESPSAGRPGRLASKNRVTASPPRTRAAPSPRNRTTLPTVWGPPHSGWAPHAFEAVAQLWGWGGTSVLRHAAPSLAQHPRAAHSRACGGF